MGDKLGFLLVIDQDSVNGVIHKPDADKFIFGSDDFAEVRANSTQEGFSFIDRRAQLIDQGLLGFDRQVAFLDAAT